MNRVDGMETEPEPTYESPLDLGASQMLSLFVCPNTSFESIRRNSTEPPHNIDVVTVSHHHEIVGSVRLRRRRDLRYPRSIMCSRSPHAMAFSYGSVRRQRNIVVSICFCREKSIELPSLHMCSRENVSRHGVPRPGSLNLGPD